MAGQILCIDVLAPTPNTRDNTSIRKVVVAAVLGLVCSHFATADDVIDFKPTPGFVRLPTGTELGQCSAVAVNSDGDIYLFHRGKRPIIRFNSKGEYEHAWGDGMFHTPHGLRIDRDDNVWVTDAGKHRVYKFDGDGKLLLALGTGKPGTAIDQFNRPTDIAFGPKGEFYVSDGYGNSRVMKFSASGKFLGSWGSRGKKPGEFHLPHSIVIDRQNRVVVGDRENNRIQVFTSEGVHVATREGFAPYGLAFDKAGNLFVADGRANQVLQLGSDGKVVRRWGSRGIAPGQFHMPHMLCFDRDGNLLVAEVNGQRLQRLERVEP